MLPESQQDLEISAFIIHTVQLRDKVTGAGRELRAVQILEQNVKLLRGRGLLRLVHKINQWHAHPGYGFVSLAGNSSEVTPAIHHIYRHSVLAVLGPGLTHFPTGAFQIIYTKYNFFQLRGDICIIISKEKTATL